MNRLTRITALLLALSLLCTLVIPVPALANNPETVQVGKQYPGGTLVTLPYANVTITIPEHWIGILPVGEESFIMRSSKIKGMLKIIALPGQQEAMIDFMDQIINLENDIQLIPAEHSQTADGRVHNRYYVTNSNEPFKGTIIGLPSTTTTGTAAHVGAGFIGLGPMAREAIYLELLKELVAEAAQARQATAPRLHTD